MAFGEILRAMREQKALSISSVAESTHMKTQIIEDLEKEDFHRIAAPIYGRGFVKLYAEFLELDPVPLIREFMDTYSGKRPAVVGKRLVEAEPDAPSAEETATPITRTVSDAALQLKEPPPRPSVRPVGLEPQGGAMPSPASLDEAADHVTPHKPSLVLEPEEHIGLTGNPDLFTPAKPPPKPGAKKQKGAIFDINKHLNSKPAEPESKDAAARQRHYARVEALLNGVKNLKTTILGGALPASAQYRKLFIVAGALLLVCVLTGVGLVALTAKRTPSDQAPRIFGTIAPIPDLYVD